MNNWKQFFRNSLFIKYSSSNLKTTFDQQKIIIYNHKKDNLFISTSTNIKFEELEELCNAVGWVKRPLQKVKLALKNSLLIITLYRENNRNTHLIGFVRVISDQAFNAIIWDMVIHPDYQKQGLGKLLMKITIQELRYIEIDTITLFADSQSISFYNRLGFITDPYNIKGMFWYPK
uniref:GCN5-like N-acetyltransferase n=1 Tax=Rhodaphanes brevistipitata TaxID=446136 RepID=UPI001FCD5EC8|nr:GCN5-like N-acetyltransferase [Rhodaphanes brevistipitata]UNJ18392.1 GCN5-like N-acetyltransferase [Rhodaphanes brevistipitata]